MALLIQQRVERPDAGERPSARRAFSSAAVCVDCVVCGSPRSQIVCPAEEMAAQRRHLTAFYRRRWRAHNAETAADRLTFTQDYTTDIVRCADCGLLYRNPRPRSDDITRAYRHDRYGDDYLETEFANQRAWARRKLPELRRHLRPSPGRRLRVLEVGSFVGGLLAEGLGRGWDMFGVDPGDEVAAFCRARGLPVFHGTLEQAELQPDSFDAVLVWNTFDQLPDPRPTLEAALLLLRDGGVLTIRIPNGACFAWAMGLLAGSRRALRTPLYTALAWNNLLTFPYIYGYSARTVAAVTASYGFRHAPAAGPSPGVGPAGSARLCRAVAGRVASRRRLGSMCLCALAGSVFRTGRRRRSRRASRGYRIGTRAHPSVRSPGIPSDWFESPGMRKEAAR
jgi:SAM-dependent methyltransferase